MVAFSSHFLCVSTILIDSMLLLASFVSSLRGDDTMRKFLFLSLFVCARFSYVRAKLPHCCCCWYDSTAAVAGGADGESLAALKNHRMKNIYIKYIDGTHPLLYSFSAHAHTNTHARTEPMMCTLQPYHRRLRRAPWKPFGNLIYRSKNRKWKKSSFPSLFASIVIIRRGRMTVRALDGWWDIKRLKRRKIWIFHYGYDDGRNFTLGVYLSFAWRKLSFVVRLIIT